MWTQLAGYETNKDAFFASRYRLLRPEHWDALHALSGSREGLNLREFRRTMSKSRAHMLSSSVFEGLRTLGLVTRDLTPAKRYVLNFQTRNTTVAQLEGRAISSSILEG
jgi:hypothetical protein